MAKDKKAKAVNFRIIAVSEGQPLPEPYRLLQEVREKFHADTRGARIALAWRYRLNPDKDGHLILGRCCKVSDLHREFADYDFIIVLNQDVWDDPKFDRAKKVALLDHELCHAAPDYEEESGEHKRDERNRLIFRTRKHDIEEFQDVVSRHGCYKRDLEKFAKALLDGAQAPLFAAQNPSAIKPAVQ